jgi:hypothetical protein
MRKKFNLSQKKRSFFIFFTLFLLGSLSINAANIAKKKNNNNEGYKEILKELQNIKEKEKKINNQLEMTKCTVTTKRKSKMPACKNVAAFSQNTTSYKNNKILKVYPAKDEDLFETPITAESITKNDKGKISDSESFSKKTKEYNANYEYEVNNDTKIGVGLNHKDKEIRQRIGQRNHKKNIDDNNISISSQYKKDGIIYKGEIGYGTGYSYKKGIKNSAPQNNYDYVSSKGNISYKKDLGNNAEFIPSVGVELKSVNERTAVKDGKSYMSRNHSDIVTSAGVKVQQEYNDKISWEAGTEYKQNLKNMITNKGNYNKTLNNETYEHGTLVTGGNIKYQKDDSMTYKLGYNFEKNKLYNNHVINFGVIYQLKD